MISLTVNTVRKRQGIDIIDAQLTIDQGLVQVFIKHTTAGLSTADLDPGTDLDLLDALDALLPDLKWRHPHNPQHAPDHFLSTIIGPAITLPLQSGKL
jgi:thiamine phosphate synthase YjbQ (UPF0047 family)